MFSQFRRDQQINYSDEDEDDRPQRRLSYPHEHKLKAIEYALHTWEEKEGGIMVPLSNYKAAERLRITPIMLSNWIKNRHQILRQRKWSRRARGPTAGREEQMETELYKLFEEA